MDSPATLAAVSDLADWLGEPITSDADTKRAGLCLRTASALVRAEAGRTWLDDDGTLADVPEAAWTVTLYCASRIYDNREATTSQRIDDHQESWKVDEAGAFLTASEKRMLAPLSASRFGGIGVISTTRGDIAPAPTGWVPTGTPGVEFPWY